MINWLSNMLCWLVLMVLIAVFGIVAGCQQEYKEEPEAPIDVIVVEPNVVVPQYASRAIEATGGLDAWTKAKKLRLDCVVTFYKSDGSFYLTEQDYEIYPWSNSIHISGTPETGQLPQNNFPEAILNIVTAPVRFLDRSLQFTKNPDAVKIEGQWYYPIEQDRLIIYDLPYWAKVVFYQNRDNSLVDMIWFATADEKKFLVVRGYDYDELQKGGVLVPAKIEIFRTDAAGVLQERLVKIDSK